MKLKIAVSLYVHETVYPGSLLPDHTTVHDNLRRCFGDFISLKMQFMMHVEEMDNTSYAVITSYVVVAFRNKAIQRRRKG